jgi:hypothetical protein
MDGKKKKKKKKKKKRYVCNQLFMHLGQKSREMRVYFLNSLCK